MHDQFGVFVGLDVGKEGHHASAVPSPHDQRAHSLPQDLTGQKSGVLTRQPLPEPSCLSRRHNLLEGDDVIRQAITDNYREVERIWAAIYEEMITARKLKLRPGITVEHMVTMAIGAVEGISLRALTDNERAYSNSEKRSLIGTMITALLIGITEPTTEAANETVEQALQRIVDI